MMLLMIFWLDIYMCVLGLNSAVYTLLCFLCCVCVCVCVCLCVCFFLVSLDFALDCNVVSVVLAVWVFSESGLSTSLPWCLRPSSIKPVFYGHPISLATSVASFRGVFRA